MKSRSGVAGSGRASVEPLEALRLFCFDHFLLDNPALLAAGAESTLAVTAAADVAVNAGGQAFTDGSGQAWTADTGFTGGSPSPATFPVANTTDDLLYSNHRWGKSFAYALPVDNGQYTLRLHFAEPVIRSRNVRVIDVTAEGINVVNDLDVFAAAGFQTALVRESTVTVSDGTLNLAFQAVKDNAMVSGIELLRIGDPPPPPPAPTVAVNAGGQPFTDGTGKAFSADAGFTGGSASPATFAVANTTDDLLYSNHRWGKSFQYAFPVDDGQYTLRLHFAEPVIRSRNVRVIDVLAEGQTVVNDLDVFAAAGFQTALVRESTVTVSDGTLNLSFQAVKDNALVSAIELVRLGDPPPPTAPAAPGGLSVTPVSATSLALSWTDNAGNETGFQIERRLLGETDFAQIVAVGANVTSYTDTGLSAANTYEYRVRATNDVGPSGYTAIVRGQPTDNPAYTKIAWSTAPNAPAKTSEAQSAVIDGKLYVFGGYYDGTYAPGGRSDVLDMTTGQWTRLPDMPAPVTHGAVAIIGREVWIAGGYLGPGGGGNQIFATKNVYKFNVDTKIWAKMPDLPEARGSGGLAYVAGKLHFFGGSDLSRKDRSEHWMVTPGQTQWEVAAAFPNPRNHLGVAVLDGKIYAIGGQKGQDLAQVAQGTVSMWDPANPTVWTDMAPVPVPRSHVAGATFVHQGRIFILGGETTYGSANAEVSAFDPNRNAWDALSPLPTKRSSGVAGAVGNVIYFIGGGVTQTVYRGVLGA